MNAVPPRIPPHKIDFAALVCAWLIASMLACFFVGAWQITGWVVGKIIWMWQS